MLQLYFYFKIARTFFYTYARIKKVLKFVRFHRFTVNDSGGNDESIKRSILI